MQLEAEINSFREEIANHEDDLIPEAERNVRSSTETMVPLNDEIKQLEQRLLAVRNPVVVGTRCWSRRCVCVALRLASRRVSVGACLKIFVSRLTRTQLIVDCGSWKVHGRGPSNS